MEKNSRILKELTVYLYFLVGLRSSFPLSPFSESRALMSPAYTPHIPAHPHTPTHTDAHKYCQASYFLFSNAHSNNFTPLESSPPGFPLAVRSLLTLDYLCPNLSIHLFSYFIFQ